MQRAYYAVIPANVRYDKNLPANAKLLYGEITALCNEKGYCWASTNYFQELYGVSRVSIQKWMRSLEENGYISRAIIYKENSKEVERRVITIVGDPGKEKLTPPLRKVSDPGKEKLTENNTFNNTNNNNMSSSSKDNIPYKKIIEYLNEQTESKFSWKSDSNRKLISGRWNEGNNLKTFLDVINLKTKQWKDNPEMSKYLRPATLFSGKNFENYKAEALAEKRKHTPKQPKNDFDFNELEKMFGENS